MANFAYRVFSEVAKQKTFVSAANVLNVTPSAISHSISGLEEELGFALFVRNRTGIMLTLMEKRFCRSFRKYLTRKLSLMKKPRESKD